MEFNEIPRKYIIGFIVVIVAILGTITLVNPGTFGFKDTTNYDAQKKAAEEETKQYQALLDSVQPDYNASKQLLQKVASEDVVRQEVETELNAKQKITVPTIPDSDIKLAARNDKPSVVDYVNRLGSIVTNYNQSTQPLASESFEDNANTDKIQTAQANTSNLLANLKSLSVPSDAVEMQKDYLAAYTTYNSFLATASDYAAGKNAEPWSNVYGQYLAIDNRLAAANSQMSKLSTKYALQDVMQPDQMTQSGLPGVKVAQAQWAVVDIEAAVRDGIKIALAKAFGKFAITMLDKLVQKIEKNFAIASQLYYSNDLGRYYTQEYMKKFVSDPVDQDIIQKFLPQYFCINAKPGELKKIYVAKARTNQGSNIVIDPNDPHFLDKLAQLGGDEKNYPNWWEEYYTTLASTAQQQADQAATKEVLSPGLKSGRDIISGQINKTMSTIFNTQSAAISGTIQLGTSNADNPISQMVAGITESLINKFVFTPIGAGQSAGGVGVLGETNVCLKTPQIKPIAPIPTTDYTPATPGN